MSQRDSSSDIHHQQLTVPLYFETHPDMTKIHEPWILGGSRLLIQYNRCRRRSSVYRFKKC
ncbi:hypothetical protein J001_04793 [Cryptococcus neoformans]|nr:hypothetical protein J001_04793 [Cryptococcus neoformans var. grubii]